MRVSKQLVFTVAAAAVLLCGVSADAYRLGNTWSRTATDGNGLQPGQTKTLTWSFPDDGTTIPPLVFAGNRSNNLIARFDSTFGAGPGGSDLTQRPWFTLFEQTFDRWSELGGATYVYEPNDDNSPTNGAVGILGTRGDIRIAGAVFDGAGGVLAYNNFPNDGDMIFDTGDMGFFGNAAQNFRAFRNTAAHEHGHGFGAFHVDSSNAGFLMEPFIQTSFDGPQFDDIRSFHRAFGDVYEKEGGDTIATAIDAGTLNDGDSFVRGIHGGSTGVGPNQTDFISIDANNDTDIFRFDVPVASEVTISLDPKGPSYREGPQGGGQSTINASNASNLTLALIDSDGTTVLDLQNAGGLGVTETISNFGITPGDYYVRVTGSTAGVPVQNRVQMYRLDINVTATGISGDFNGDGDYACDDVDSLVMEIVAGTNNGAFDLTGDGLVNAADLTAWRTEAGAAEIPNGNPYQPADANLDGVVDAIDFTRWNDNKFQSVAAFCSGDFNADGVVDGVDFTIWNNNKFTAADAMMVTHGADSVNVVGVPEPATGLMLVFLLGIVASVRRR